VRDFFLGGRINTFRGGVRFWCSNCSWDLLGGRGRARDSDRFMIQKDLRKQEPIGALIALDQVRLEGVVLCGRERVFQVALGHAVLVDVAMVHFVRNSIMPPSARLC